MYRIPTSFTAGRSFILKGVAFAKGDSIGPNEIQSLGRKLQAYVARRLVIPNQDPSARRTKLETPTPTYISSSALKTFFSQQAPNMPIDVSVTPGNHQVTLTWTAIDGPQPDPYDFWVLYKRTADNDQQWQLFYDGESTSTTITVTGLTNGTQYDFKVLSQSVNGNSNQTAVIHSTPTAG